MEGNMETEQNEFKFNRSLLGKILAVFSFVLAVFSLLLFCVAYLNNKSISMSDTIKSLQIVSCVTIIISSGILVTYYLIFRNRKKYEFLVSLGLITLCLAVLISIISAFINLSDAISKTSKHANVTPMIFETLATVVMPILCIIAFGTAHRAHATTAGVADYLPAVCGYLIQKEIGVMGKALADPARPFVAILGGAKVSDKIGVINNLIEKVDTLIIGGGMAYTFFKALGYNVGTSLCEDDKVELAKEMMAKAESKGVKFLIPVDNKLGKEYDENTESMFCNSNEIPDGWMGLDIGPKTQELFANAIKGAGTVVWNGPMGVSEWKNFAAGTEAVANAVAESGAISIIGGGDSAAAVEKLGFAEKMTHISTGGGASLEFLEGLELPGIACLQDK